MSYILNDHEQSFIACFSEHGEDQFTLLLTNFVDFYKEDLNKEEIESRSDDENEILRVKLEKVIRTLKTEKPSNCAIIKNDDDESLRINLSFPLNFAIKSHSLKFYFNVDKCNSNEIGKFYACGLMKLLIENNLMIDKLRKAVEAKDQEIDDYKSNGATLIRGE